jgi:nicotinate-nucleotide adenylyltransferase
MKQIGLFFGSFNPVHQGHLILANYLVEETALEEVWFVITPQSPFKQKQRLLDNHHRLAMVEEAIEDYPKLKSSTVEFGLPAPQYTALSVAHLKEKHPETQFSLIMGQDHLKSFHKWYNYEELLQGHKIYVYPRMPEERPARKQPKPEVAQHPHLVLVNAPVVEISSSYIRKAHKAGKNVRPLLPPAVWKYMDEMNFYR